MSGSPQPREWLHDKALVDEKSRTVYGLPYALTIGDGTFCAHPRLAGTLHRRHGDKYLVWPRDAARRLGFALRSTATLTEVWRCHIDLSMDQATLSVARPDDAAVRAAQRFSHAMSPTWLYRLLEWNGESVVGEDHLRSLRWSDLHGNPSADWLMNTEYINPAEDEVNPHYFGEQSTRRP